MEEKKQQFSPMPKQWTKEDWLAWFKEENDVRQSETIQQLYDKKQNWEVRSLREVTLQAKTILCQRHQLDSKLVIPASIEASEQFHSDPDFQIFPFIKYDIRREGELKAGSMVPEVIDLYELDDGQTSRKLSDFLKENRPTVISAGSFT
jgi:hypothetical protein